MAPTARPAGPHCYSTHGVRSRAATAAPCWKEAEVSGTNTLLLHQHASHIQLSILGTKQTESEFGIQETQDFLGVWCTRVTLEEILLCTLTLLLTVYSKCPRLCEELLFLFEE